MVMHFANTSNLSKCLQNVVYKRCEIGMPFCESTDFLADTFSALFELFIKTGFIFCIGLFFLNAKV